VNQILAEKIIKDLKKFSNKKYAVTNDLGEVFAATKDFSLKHSPLDTKSQRAIKVCYQDKPCGFIYIDEPLKIVRETEDIIKSMAELIIQQAKYTEILTNDEKRIDQIAYDFFYTESIENQDLVKVLNSFEIDITKNRVAIFVEISDSKYLMLFEREVIEGEREKITARAKRGIEAVINSFYTSHSDNLVFYIGYKNFLILKDMGQTPKDYQEDFKKTLGNLHFNLNNELRTKTTIGVGNYKDGLAGLKESFEEAKTALRFGKQIWGENKIYHYDNFGVIAPLFSGASEKNIGFSKKVIKKLNQHEDLLKTLEIYFENNLSLSKTAKKLRIHRNTLVYRLERIEDITDLDPKKFNDAFQLYMAMILGAYHG